MRTSGAKVCVLAFFSLLQSACDRSPYLFEKVYAPDRPCSMIFDRSGEKKTITIAPDVQNDIVYVSPQSKFVASMDDYWLWADKRKGDGMLTLILQSRRQGKYSEEIGIITIKNLEEVFAKCPFMRQKIHLENPSL